MCTLPCGYQVRHVSTKSVPSSKGGAAIVLHPHTEGRVELEQSDAANRLATFFERVYTEYNMAAATSGDAVGRPGRWSRMSKIEQREIPSPECISEGALLEMLGGRQEPVAESSDDWVERPWDELDRILYGYYPDQQGGELRGPMCDLWAHARGAIPSQGAGAAPGSPKASPDLSTEEWRARARRAFVATLSEWMQMHDYHSPFPDGPHAKGQSCAKVENVEKVSCGKLYPRKKVPVGEEEVSEDPRRRELHRLWIARNCAFLKKFVPLVALAMFRMATVRFGSIRVKRFQFISARLAADWGSVSLI